MKPEEAIYAVSHAILMARATASFPVRDRLGLSDLQAEAQAELAFNKLVNLMLDGCAAIKVCDDWGRTAEYEARREQYRAEFERPEPVQPRGVLPAALNRGERRREERRRKKEKASA